MKFIAAQQMNVMGTSTILAVPRRDIVSLRTENSVSNLLLSM
jgi:hypothetical protein